MLRISKRAIELEQHEDVFLARYGRLHISALRLTGGDRARADDLIQDAFVHFTRARPNLDALVNLDGYLYRMLRNLHVSEVRRAARSDSRSLAAIDYDSAELVLRVVDPASLIRTQDELRLICRYACIRKESSKAGSVLALRFLHGYYPQEIARVMCASRQAVEERLRVARAEARNYLNDPGGLSFMRGATHAAEKLARVKTGFAQPTDELLADLRRTIFAVRQGSCLTREHLSALYENRGTNQIDCRTLSHLVSCARCLDAANHQLGLPPLAERYPPDVLGNDDRNKAKDHRSGGGGDDGDDGAGGAGVDGEAERGCRRRARDLFEHRPQELRICVNGYTAAAARITSDLCEHTINTNESIDFIEIFSEQDVRLLFINREELLDVERRKQSVTLTLSDERSLRVVVGSGAQTAIYVTYQDPLMRPDPVGSKAARIEPLTLLRESGKPSATGEDEARSGYTITSAWQRMLAWLAARLPSPRMLKTATAGLVAVALIAVLLVRTLAPAVSAAELLRRAAIVEETAGSNPYFARQRTLLLEEREGKEGKLISRRKIEIWQSASRKTEARRVYTERGELVAGRWGNEAGAVIYRSGAQPETEERAQPLTSSLAEDGSAWRLDATPQSFVDLVGDANAVSVEETEGNYVFKYDARSSGGGSPLLRASLVLKRSDLIPLEETLLVAGREGAREYKLIVGETRQRFEHEVDSSVFVPDPELRGTKGVTATRGRWRSPDIESAPTPDSPPTQTSATARASAELEVEVTYLLNEIKANLGEQVSLTRTQEDLLRVEALVETEQRKEEVLRSLGSVRNNPAIRIDVLTVAEAAKSRRESSSPVIEREVETITNQIPASAELRRHLRAQGRGASEHEIAQLADRIMDRSRRGVLHASALQRLVKRFPAREVDALAPDARDKWRRMIREHAQSYRREAAALRRELRSVFPGAPANERAATGAPATDATKAAAQLLR